MTYEQEIWSLVKASRFNELWSYVINLEKHKIFWEINSLIEGNSLLFWAVCNQGNITNRLSRKAFIKYLLMHDDFCYVNKLSCPSLQSSFLIAARNDDTEIIKLFFEGYEAGKEINLISSNNQLIVELLQKEIDFVKAKYKFSEPWLEKKKKIYNELMKHAVKVANLSNDSLLLMKLKRLEILSLIHCEEMQTKQLYIEKESLEKEDSVEVEYSLRAEDYHRAERFSRVDDPMIRSSSSGFFTPLTTPCDDESHLPNWLQRSSTSTSF